MPIKVVVTSLRLLESSWSLKHHKLLNVRGEVMCWSDLVAKYPSILPLWIIYRHASTLDNIRLHIDTLLPRHIWPVSSFWIRYYIDTLLPHMWPVSSFLIRWVCLVPQESEIDEGKICMPDFKKGFSKLSFQMGGWEKDVESFLQQDCNSNKLDTQPIWYAMLRV